MARKKRGKAATAGGESWDEWEQRRHTIRVPRPAENILARIDQRLAESAAQPFPADESEQLPPPKQRRTPPGWAQKPVIGKLREKYSPHGIPPEGTTISEACRGIGLDPAHGWHTVDRAVERLKEAKRLKG